MYNSSEDVPGEARQFGPYRLLRPIGHGGMATVYEGVDTRIDRRVAIKVQTPSAPPPVGSHAPHEEESARVVRHEREARLLANLSHPNIVTVYDIGEQDGSLYMVMEYLDGVTLQQYLAGRGGRPLSPAEAADILDGIAQGLDALHHAGVVHRDLKSGNVMLLESGGAAPVVKLLDLGIARPAADLLLTRTGVILGSPSYVAPEVLQGRTATESADLWALGILLYEMLGGGLLPFPGDELPAVLYRIAHEPPAPLPGLPAPIQSVLTRALSKDPAARYPTAGMLARAFRAAAIPVAGQAGEFAPRRRRNPVLAPMLALAAFLVLCFFAGWSWQSRTTVVSSASMSATPSPFPTPAREVPRREAPRVAVVPSPRPTDPPRPVSSPLPRKAAVTAPGPIKASPSPFPEVVVHPKPSPSPLLYGYVEPTIEPTIEPTPEPQPTPTPYPSAYPSPETPVASPAPLATPSVVASGEPIQAAVEKGNGNKENENDDREEAPPKYLTETGAEGARAALDAWLDASMFGDIDTLMRFYARRMERYGPAGSDIPRAAVRADKERLLAGDRPLGIDIDNPKITLDDDKTRATIRFRENSIWSDGQSERRTRVEREMVWVFTEEGWKIVGERVLR